MGKKKKTKKKEKNKSYLDPYVVTKSKKDIDKDFQKAIKKIEKARMEIYEADKKKTITGKRKINKEAKEFFDTVEGIECRMKITKKWEKKGFFDELISLLHQLSPLVQLLAKLIMMIIVSILSIDVVYKNIKPKTLKKMKSLYDFAMVV